LLPFVISIFFPSEQPTKNKEQRTNNKQQTKKNKQQRANNKQQLTGKGKYLARVARRKFLGIFGKNWAYKEKIKTDFKRISAHVFLY